MGENSLATHRGLAKSLSGVEFFSLVAASCLVTGGTKEGGAASVLADATSNWKVEHSPRSFKATQEMGVTGCGAMVVVPLGDMMLDDVTFELSGESSFDGSAAGKNVNFSFSDSAKAQIDRIDADSVLITAFGNSHVVVSEILASRILVIVDDLARVEVLLTNADLILVRQTGGGQASFMKAMRFSSEVNAPVFALTGNRSKIHHPPSAYLAPQDVVDEYWRLLSSDE